MPTNYYTLVYNRFYASIAETLIGTTITALNVLGTQLGGFYCNPFRVPLYFDRSRDAFLTAYIGNTSGVGPAAGDVALQAIITVLPPAAAPFNLTPIVVVPIAAAWPQNSWLEVDLLNAGLPPIPAFSIPDKSLLGVRFQRNGPAATDTWTGQLALVTSLTLRYNELCRTGCLP